MTLNDCRMEKKSLLTQRAQHKSVRFFTLKAFLEDSEELDKLKKKVNALDQIIKCDNQTNHTLTLFLM